MQVHPFRDLWLPKHHLFKLITFGGVSSDHWRVSNILLSNPTKWNELMVREMFWEGNNNCILNLSLGYNNARDRLTWHYDRKGKYSVKSSFWAWMSAKRTTSSSRGNDNHKWWNYLWNLGIPSKVKTFIWQIFMISFLPWLISTNEGLITFGLSEMSLSFGNYFSCFMLGGVCLVGFYLCFFLAPYLCLFSSYI